MMHELKILWYMYETVYYPIYEMDAILGTTFSIGINGLKYT